MRNVICDVMIYIIWDDLMRWICEVRYTYKFAFCYENLLIFRKYTILKRRCFLDIF